MQPIRRIRSTAELYNDNYSALLEPSNLKPMSKVFGLSLGILGLSFAGAELCRASLGLENTGSLLLYF
jgi:hypothetical protein